MEGNKKTWQMPYEWLMSSKAAGEDTTTQLEHELMKPLPSHEFSLQQNTERKGQAAKH